ncbi:hypothetical protein [Eupransor demetentiae]|uniref:Uncharacterized protein n=1 Tax=Eupransor demetentiae TaxID=3109584 RepID=A0ABM9N4R7_9LACO|nr:hypothetical protein R54876_GBNLAHCA_00724 [Lactobacillaceae bacterium LMG 33000]
MAEIEDGPLTIFNPEKEESNMAHEFATKTELTELKHDVELNQVKTDSKLNLIDSKVDSLDKNLSLKIDNLELMVSSKIETKTNTMIMWFIGTSITLFGLLVTVIKLWK